MTEKVCQLYEEEQVGKVREGRKASHNKLLQNIKDSYKTATLVINIAISMTDCTNCMKQPHKPNRNAEILPGTRKLNT